MNQLKGWKPRFSLNRFPRGAGLFLVSLLLLAAGCATVPPHAVPVLPAPVTSFPPTKPGLVRLPVVIIFPTGGDVFQHLANFFKGGLKQIVPDLRGIPVLRKNSVNKEGSLSLKSHAFTNIGFLIELLQELYIDQVNTGGNPASTCGDALCSIEGNGQANFLGCRDDHFGNAASHRRNKHSHRDFGAWRGKIQRR